MGVLEDFRSGAGERYCPILDEEGEIGDIENAPDVLPRNEQGDPGSANHPKGVAETLDDERAQAEKRVVQQK